MATLRDLKDDFEVADEGSYTATLTRFVDLGLQKTAFGNSRMLSLCFELADITTSDGKPMLVFKSMFNYSKRSKKLRELLRTLSGFHDVSDVDPRTLLGTTCQVDLTHRITNDGATFPDIEVRRGKPGAKRPKVKSDALYFSMLTIDDFKQGELDALPERQREKIKAVGQFANLINSYNMNAVHGDKYAGEWPREQFRWHGVHYRPSEKSKSQIYAECLPLVNSGRASLLDDPKMINQLVSLERKTARGGGRDVVDHPPNAHDDLINAAAGALIGCVGTWTTTSHIITGSGIDAFRCHLW